MKSKRHVAIYLIIIGIFIAIFSVFKIWGAQKTYNKEREEIKEEWSGVRSSFHYNQIKKRYEKDRRFAITGIVLSGVLVVSGIVLLVFEKKKEQDIIEEPYISKVELAERYSNLSNNDLLDIAHSRGSEYTEDAKKIANSILDKRGIKNP